MPTVGESMGRQSQIAAALDQAVEQLGIEQVVRFQAYTRVVLPMDGYVFWSPTVKVEARGVLHFAQDVTQSEDETVGLAGVTFMTQKPLTDFAAIGQDTLLVARIGPFRYAFSQQAGYQKEARTWHYAGRSIIPALAAQLLDDPSKINPNAAVVSNSLPAWLAINGWDSGLGGGWLSNLPANENGLGITLYPSFVVPPNLAPPYGVVHIGPEDTNAMQSVPFRDATGSSWQLASDRVRITLYGLQNNAAIDFLNLVLQYIEFTENIGLMNMPIVRDGKRGQVELQAIAMQKYIDFEVSYNETRIADLARTLIEQASFSFAINEPPYTFSTADSGNPADGTQSVQP